jgi:hypothetical protein
VLLSFRSISGSVCRKWHRATPVMTTSRATSLLSTPNRVARDWSIADCLSLVEVLHAANVLTSCRPLALLYKLGIPRIRFPVFYPNQQARTALPRLRPSLQESSWGSRNYGRSSSTGNRLLGRILGTKRREVDKQSSVALDVPRNVARGSDFSRSMVNGSRTQAGSTLVCAAREDVLDVARY